MNTPHAALKGKLGNTDYFLLFMRAEDLVELTHIRDDEEWQELELDDRTQREVNISRIDNQLVNYLKKQDRFFGSVILANENWDSKNFQPINKLIDESTISHPFSRPSQCIGFYTFSGKEKLEVLDGQHRISAIEKTIKELKNEKSEDLDKLCNDQIAVVLIQYKKDKARKIFTEVNSTARRTSTGQTLTTDDYDVLAVMSRFIVKKHLNKKIVSTATNQLYEWQKEFTTLPTIADGCKSILTKCTPFRAKERHELPSEAKLRMYENALSHHWKYLLENIEDWKDVLKDKSKEGGEYRAERRALRLSLRPITMQAIIEAYSYVTHKRIPLPREEAVFKINNIPWHNDALLWKHVLMAGGHIQPKNRKLVTLIIIFILEGYKCRSDAAKNTLLDGYRKVLPFDEVKKATLDTIKKYAISKE